MVFKDRIDAGRKLAKALTSLKGQEAVVYALPRGGVVLGVEVARVLQVPLDLIVVRKIGHPRSPEYAIAAVAEDGHMVTNPAAVESIDEGWFSENVQLQQREARRRRDLFMGGHMPVSATGRIAIIVDDGLATGLTMLAAIEEARHFRPRKILVAVPVASREAVSEIERVVDGVVALHISASLGAIGEFYENFEQVSDAEVTALMASAARTPENDSKMASDM
jgi:predicted phosphoribosyltransferase